MNNNQNKKNKNYYKYHNNHNWYNNKNNHNKNFYYYKKKNKQNNVIVENNQNNNILLNNNLEQKEEQVIKQYDNYQELNIKPLKKEEVEFTSKKGIFKYALGFLLLVIMLFGVTYSFFTYRKEDSRQADVASGEVYVTLVEQATSLSLTRMYPRTNEEARSRDDNYIDFTVKAKNTSETKSIYYNININNGEDVSGKTRINPQYLIIDLQEKVGNEYTYVKNAIPLSSFEFSDEVRPNTTSEITKEYRLRIWVSDAIIISDTETGATYTQAQFNNLYGNVNITVDSNDGTPSKTGTDKVLEAIEAKQNATTNSCNPVWIDVNGTQSDESDDITYFSGTETCVDMNYVWYSGKLWRITAIYPDGAMKLVTQNNITSIAFNESSVNFYTNSNTTSYMYQWLNEDFYDTLYNANQFIDITKRWNITQPATTDVRIKPQETNMVTANVGLINNYEYYNSYRCVSSATCNGAEYFTGYLNIGYYWWLLNQYDNTYVWSVLESGYGNNNNPNFSIGVRPSIIIKSGLEFTGDGTSSSPYKIVGDKDVGNVNELINTRLSGEYVKFSNGTNNQLFRIIGVEDNKTKIIAMDYAENKNTRKFATSSGNANTLWGSGTTTGTDTWYEYLNRQTTGYLDTLKSTYGELFDSGLYYLGTSGMNYKLSVCANATSENTKVCDKTNNKGTFNIGLPRYGEMFATQQAGGHSNSTVIWLMNRRNVGNVSSMTEYGYVDYGSAASMHAARPTVHLKSTVKILSGSGTETDPYVVGL